VPDQRPCSQTPSLSSANHDPLGGADRDSETLRIARRMHQLASEIQAAHRRNDLKLVRHASTLLAPTLAQWQSAPPVSEPAAQREAARLAQEARRLLDETAEALVQYGGHITSEIRRLRKSRQMLARIRQRRAPAVARRLDIKY